MPIVCASCGSDVSPTWWKCCPKHTTEQGVDVVCQPCANTCLNRAEVVIHKEVLVGDSTLRDGSKLEIYVLSPPCLSCGEKNNVKDTPVGKLCMGCIQKFQEWLILAYR